MKQDLPVVLEHGKRGLLSIDDGRLDLLQLSSDGNPPKRLMSAPLRLVLLAKLGTAPATATSASGAPAPAPSTATTEVQKRLDLHALVQKGAKSHALHPTKIHVLVEASHVSDAEAWCAELMAAAYPVTAPCRRVLLLINPVGGKGKAKTLVTREVVPVLEAAGCKVDLRETTHRGHAEEICASIPLDYDVIATASGDGIIYEVLNGLGSRPDARRALRIPIAPIPTGSANACNINLMGIKDTFNLPLAALNAVKGQPTSVDLCSILLLPEGKRRLSFLSQATGLMVDADIGTENLRWMGDARFMWGFLRGIASNKGAKMRMELDVVQSDKATMEKEARDDAHRALGKTYGGGTDPLDLLRGVQAKAPKIAPELPAESRNGTAMPSSSKAAPAAAPAVNGDATASVNGGEDQTQPVGTSAAEDTGPLPPAHPLQPTSSWLTIDASSHHPAQHKKPFTNNWEQGQAVLFMYAGLMPYVARDLNQWPVIRTGSGVMDVVVQRVVARTVLLNAISGAEFGKPFYQDSQLYLKVRGYTCKNLDKKHQPQFTIDGEAFDWDEFHVEVLPRAGTVASLDGRLYISDFFKSANNVNGKGGKKKKST